jgi:hypothetical protein
MSCVHAVRDVRIECARARPQPQLPRNGQGREGLQTCRITPDFVVNSVIPSVVCIERRAPLTSPRTALSECIRQSVATSRSKERL